MKNRINILLIAFLTFLILFLTFSQNVEADYFLELNNFDDFINSNKLFGENCPSQISGRINQEIICGPSDTINLIGNTQFIENGKLVLNGATLEFTGPYKLTFEKGTEFLTQSNALVNGNGPGEIIALPGSKIEWGVSTFQDLNKLHVHIITHLSEIIITENTFQNNQVVGPQFDYEERLAGNGLTIVCHDYRLEPRKRGMIDSTIQISGNTAEYNENAGFHFEECNGLEITGTISEHNDIGVRFYKEPLETTANERAAINYEPENKLEGSTVTNNNNGVITYETEIDYGSGLGTINENDEYGLILIDLPYDTQIENLVQRVGEDNGVGKAVLMYSARVETRNGHTQSPLGEFSYVIAQESDWTGNCRNGGYSDAFRYDEPSERHTCQGGEIYTTDLVTEEPWRTYTTPETIRERIPSGRPIINNQFTPLFLVRRFYWRNNNQRKDVCEENHGCLLVAAKILAGHNIYEGWIEYIEYEKPLYGIVYARTFKDSGEKPQQTIQPRIETQQTQQKESTPARQVKPARVVLRNLG